MPLSVSPIAAPTALLALSDAGKGGDGFAPIFGGLLDPDGTVPTCTLLPPAGESLPELPVVAPPAVMTTTPADTPTVGADPSPYTATCLLPVDERFAATPPRFAPAPAALPAEQPPAASAPTPPVPEQPAMATCLVTFGRRLPSRTTLVDEAPTLSPVAEDEPIAAPQTSEQAPAVASPPLPIATRAVLLATTALPSPAPTVTKQPTLPAETRGVESTVPTARSAPPAPPTEDRREPNAADEPTDPPIAIAVRQPELAAQPTFDPAVQMVAPTPPMQPQVAAPARRESETSPPVISRPSAPAQPPASPREPASPVLDGPSAQSPGTPAPAQPAVADTPRVRADDSQPRATPTPLRERSPDDVPAAQPTSAVEPAAIPTSARASDTKPSLRPLRRTSDDAANVKPVVTPSQADTSPASTQPVAPPIIVPAQPMANVVPHSIQPVATPSPAPAPIAARTSGAPAQAVSMPIASTAPVTTPPAATPAAVPPARFAAPLPSPAATIVSTSAAQTAGTPAVPEHVPGQRPSEVATTPTTRATLPTPVADATPAPVIQPALQAFGAAMRQALADERKPARAVEDIAAPTPALATTAPLAAQPVTAAAPTLDTGDRRWPHAMAEQIDRLRDAANESSTRIRLLPDALGPVDVAVRRDGDAVHVHFTAAQAETRQLLQDAQPRLAEAADARGLKLGRTDVSGGDLPERRQQAAPQPQTPSRPAPARTRAAVPDTTDTRIA